MSEPVTCGCHRPRALLSAVAAALHPSGAQPLAAPLPVEQRSKQRRRLWEVSVKHHCVLLGAAFDARELRQMFRRGGYADWQSASDYELHSSAVCFAKSRNDFSALAQKGLEERFRSAIHRLAGATNGDDLVRLWQALVEEGDAVGAYWAALTHPACDADLDEAFSRQMHMIAHEEFAARRASLRRVRALEQRNKELLDRQAAVQQSVEAVRRENAGLREALDVARIEAQRAQIEAERWRTGEMARAKQARHAELEKALEASRDDTAAARRALREAERRLERMQAPLRLVEQRHALPAQAEPEPMRPPDLAGRRVLCIGGKASLTANYRTLVEDAGGNFLHHDGGIEDHVGRLPAMLGAAELVICLSGDCSHAAYRIAKRYCKAKGKPCALLGSSSLTAVARSLGALGSSNEEHEWNRQGSHSLRFISSRRTATSGS